MSDSLPRTSSETARHRLRLTVSDSQLDNALWNITPRNDIPTPLYLFSLRSFDPTEQPDLLLGEYNQSVYHAMYGKKFEYTDPRPVQAVGEYAVRFLVRFGHEARARIITEPLVDKETITDDEESGQLTFLYAFSPPVNVELATKAMQVIDSRVGERALSSLAIVSDEQPFASSVGVVMPPRYRLDTSGA